MIECTAARSPKPVKVTEILSDVKVGRTCMIELESGERTTTAIVRGWLKNIKGYVYIKTDNEVYIGLPNCDRELMNIARVRRRISTLKE